MESKLEERGVVLELGRMVPGAKDKKKTGVESTAEGECVVMPFCSGMGYLPAALRPHGEGDTAQADQSGNPGQSSAGRKARNTRESGYNERVAQIVPQGVLPGWGREPQGQG